MVKIKMNKRNSATLFLLLSILPMICNAAAKLLHHSVDCGKTTKFVSVVAISMLFAAVVEK